MNIKHNKNLEFCNVSETIVAGVFIDTSQKNNSELSYHFFCNYKGHILDELRVSFNGHSFALSSVQLFLSKGLSKILKYRRLHLLEIITYFNCLIKNRKIFVNFNDKNCMIIYLILESNFKAEFIL